MSGRVALQEAVQDLVLRLCQNRLAAAFLAWREQCQEASAGREAERQSLQAAVRRLARARQAAVLCAWQLHAKAKSAQRQLCLHAIRQFPHTDPLHLQASTDHPLTQCGPVMGGVLTLLSEAVYE